MTPKDAIRNIANVIFFLTGSVWALPSCRVRLYTEIVCVAGKTDYLLKEGLVSNNNYTAAVTLKGCRITGVELGAFKNMFNLEEIDLSSNKINELKVGVFDNLSKLLSLRLSQNLLTTLSVEIFEKLPKLQRLDLSDNMIHTFQLGIFNHFPKLVRLELSNNAFLGKHLDPSLFNRNPKINYLHFSGNDMSEAPDQLLNAIRGIKVLGLNNCSLTEMPKFVTNANLKMLAQLYLKLNQLKLDDPELFVNFENVMYLDLAGNEIKNLNERVFKSLTKLNTIDLSYNTIEKIPETLFRDLLTVQSIDLSNNLIDIIPVNAFRGTRMKILNLSANRISFLDNNFLLELRNSATRLTTFYFIDNPLQCACLLEILNEVKKYGVSYNSDKYNGEKAVCIMTNQFTCMRKLLEFEYPIDMRQTSTEIST